MSTGGARLDVGPLSLDRGGLHVNPQMKLGARVENAMVEVGMDDLRDGIRMSAKAQLQSAVEVAGRTLSDLHENISSDTPGFNQALDRVKRILAWRSKKDGGEAAASEDDASNEKIADALGMSHQELERAMTMGSESLPNMTLKVIAELSVGATVDVKLGWANRAGYHMVGVGGSVAMGGDLAGKLFAGMHKSRSSFKVIIGIANFTFEYTFPFMAAPGAAPGGSEAGASGKKCTLM